MGLSHSPSIITNGLVLCLDAGNAKSYPGSGTIWTDLSGNNLNATISNSPTYSLSNSGSLTYSGANTGATATSTSSLLNVGTGNFTLECWAKPSNLSLYMLPVSLDDNLTGNGLIFYLSAPGNNFRTWIAGTAHNSTTTLSNNTWYHLVISRSAGIVSKYINGVLDSTHTASGSCSTGQTIKIGWRYDAGYNFSGSISKVSFYNVALTAAQVLQNYSASAIKFTTPSLPVSDAVLSLDAANSSSYSGSGTLWNDLSGNAYNATLTNGPTYSSSNSGFIAFDGTDDYAALPYSGLVDLGNDYTITAFIKLANITQAIAPIFSNMDVNNGVTTKGIAFYWYKTAEYGMSANVLRLQQGLSGWAWNVYASDANTIIDTNWHFVSLRVSNALTTNPTITFNVDGVNKTSVFWNASGKAAANYTSATGSIRVGSIYTASAPAYSTSYGALSVANLRVYKRALSNQEIGTTFDALRGRFGL